MLQILFASAVAATLASDLQEIAKLPGEPSIVSAAGFTAGGEPILSLENPSAFDPQSKKRRVVIFAAAGSDERTAGVLSLVGDGETQTRCADCGAALSMAVRDGRVHGSGVVHFAVPPRHFWENVAFT